MNSEDQNVSLPKLIRRMVSGALIKLRDDPESTHPSMCYNQANEYRRWFLLIPPTP